MIYFSFLLMGAVLGLVGGGGAILTIPILMTFAQYSVIDAGTASLFIVGLLSLVGTIQGTLKKEIQWQALIPVFAWTGSGVLVARLFLVPNIPRNETSEAWISSVLAILLITVGIKMWKPKQALPPQARRRSLFYLYGQLFGVGLLTGFLGAGGGFLMIPVLVFLYSLPLHRAIPTSMALVSLNTLFGFALSRPDLTLLPPLLLYSGAGVIGLALGIYFREKLPEALLRKGFGTLAGLVGLTMLASLIQ